MRQVAYFHRMGHTVCEKCRWTGANGSALIAHLEAHHPTDLEMIERLRAGREWYWDRAALEGASSLLASRR